MSLEKASRLKTLFLGKITGKLKDHLAEGILKDYASTYTWEFAGEIVKEDIKEIDNYLKTHSVTLYNMDEHADYILKNILIPYLKRKKVE